MTQTRQHLSIAELFSHKTAKPIVIHWLNSTNAVLRVMFLRVCSMTAVAWLSVANGETGKKKNTWELNVWHNYRPGAGALRSLQPRMVQRASTLGILQHRSQPNPDLCETKSAFFLWVCGRHFKYNWFLCLVRFGKQREKLWKGKDPSWIFNLGRAGAQRPCSLRQRLNICT